ACGWDCGRSRPAPCRCGGRCGGNSRRADPGPRLQAVEDSSLKDSRSPGPLPARVVDSSVTVLSPSKEVAMSPLRRWLLPFALLVVFAATLAAQTTGDIVGRVTDEAGGVLPGVAVEAKSPALQGSRTAVTDGTGTYTGQGFATEAKQGVTVGLDKDATLNVSLRAALTESITVTSDAPVVDTTSAAVGTNMNAATIQTLPTGRNYSSVVQIMPGVSSDANADNSGQTSISVYGSTGAENVFYIDGVNTTGAEYGFQGKELNFEFIQAVDVKTGGYEAEFGRATGGIISVIT